VIHVVIGRSVDPDHAPRYGRPVRVGAGSWAMLTKLGRCIAALSAVLTLASCSSMRTGACQCPKPVAYDEPTLKKISQALRALPADNVLHQAMEDYENERDDLRFCPKF
jgi:hypothetical protein